MEDFLQLREHPQVEGITRILEQVKERVEGNLICDVSPRNYVIERNKDKIHNLQHICKGKKHIIEIGVNACHSLLLMLMVNPNARYVLFDLKYHRYTEPILEYIRQQFPKTEFHIVYGNSVETMRQYIIEHPEEKHAFDFIHLDGGHSSDVFEADFRHSRQLLKPDGVVIFDDYNIRHIHQFVNRQLSEGYIEEYKEANVIPNPYHFVYTYTSKEVKK